MQKIGKIAHYRLCEILVGIYFICFAVSLFPYATEIFVQTGYFPLVSFSVNSDFDLIIVQALFVVLFLGSIGLVLKKMTYVASLLVLLGYIFIIKKNLIVSTSPESFFVPWALLGLVLSGDSEHKPATYQISFGEFKKYLWIVTVLFYFLIGINKLIVSSELWLSGDIIKLISSESIFRRSWYGDSWQYMPDWGFQLASLVSVLLELLAPLALFNKKIKKFWWAGVLLMHLWILFFMSLFIVSMGMILSHFFLFEEDWFTKTKT